MATVTTKDVEERMITLRKQQVLLDCDVAELYGVQTKEVNQAVRNNPHKFPYGYIFVLDKYEKEEVVKNFDHLNKLKYSRVPPTAFTERGLYMLATILHKSVNWLEQWKPYKSSMMVVLSKRAFCSAVVIYWQTW